tara:strand:- start:1868 stop:3289 length:1422 start_codon:yes stop_codon:yes gene_type:complete
MKKFFKSLGRFNKFIIVFLIIIFSLLSYLSIPALYEYERLQKELSNKVLDEFNLNLSLSNEIKYHIFPSPNFTINDNLLNFNVNELENFGELKKVKIFISIKNLFNQNKLKINEIKFYESNFTINKQNFKYFSQFLREKTKNPLKIINSKVFFKDKENDETLAIANISNGKIVFDQKNNKKIFSSDGTIFNTNYNLDLGVSLENVNLIDLILNFQELNLKIKNQVSLKNDYKKVIGQTYIDLFREKIKLKYNIINSNITFETEKNSKIKFSGIIDQSPFYFQIKMFLKNADIQTLLDINSKLENYLNKNYLLNKNFNGKLLINIDKVYGSKYLDGVEISASFLNGKINLNGSKIGLDKLGVIHLNDFNISTKKNKVLFETKNLFEVSNLAQFNRVFQLPKNKKRNIENIYFEINKIVSSETLSINKIVINNEINKPDFKKIDVLKDIQLKSIDNLNNWFDLKYLVRKLLTEIN